MTVKQLKHRISRTAEALEREHRKNVEVSSRVGWGAGMRRVHIGPSFSRENELEGRLRDYKKQLAELEGTNETRF